MLQDSFHFLVLTFDLLFILAGDPTVFGNLSPPDEVIDAVVESVRSMRFNGYAPSTGKKKRHSFICGHMK